MSNDDQLITLTADIVSSHLANNTVAVGDVSNVIKQVHSALVGLGTPQVQEPEKKNPVVSIRASIKPDHLVCLECGKKQKTLKRHLQTAHSITPDQYRKDYGLPRDYPMVSPDYSEQRRNLAHSSGLGRKKNPSAGGKEASGKPKRAPRGRGRSKKARAEGE